MVNINMFKTPKYNIRITNFQQKINETSYAMFRYLPDGFLNVDITRGVEAPKTPSICNISRWIRLSMCLTHYSHNAKWADTKPMGYFLHVINGL